MVKRKKRVTATRSKRGAAVRRAVAKRQFPWNLVPLKRSNPPKMRKVTKSSGWIKATAVRFVKRRGKPIEVLVRQPAKRRRKK